LTLQRDNLKDKLKKTFKITEQEMKLTDILREIEGDEDTQQGPNSTISYDPAVKPISPSTIQDIVNALTDINNYDKLIKTKFALRDTGGGKEPFPKNNNPNQLLSFAKEEWNKLSEDGKLRKIKNIKNRVFIQTIDGKHVSNYAGKKAWEENIANNEAVQDAYNDWENEGNEGNIESYLSSLSFDELKNTGLLGTKGVNYWPQKPYTKDDEILMNQATMRDGENFIVTDDRVIFPLTPNKPFLGTQGEQGLRNIVNSILKNAKISVEQADVVRGTTSSTPSDSTTSTSTRPKKDEVAPLTYTSTDKNKVDKAIKAFKNAIGDVQGAKYEESSFKDENNVTQYKVTVTGVSAANREKLFNVKKTTLKESLDFDLERYQMLRRAGIIK
jgi:hypothetical protein